MLARIARSGITFQQIQGHRNLLQCLLILGANLSFRDGFLRRREGHVSSESSEGSEGSDDNAAGPVPAPVQPPVQPPAQAQARPRGRRPRAEDDPAVGRRQRQRRR